MTYASPDTFDYPSQNRMEEPLLRLLIGKGGSVWFSVCGDEIAVALADHFGLSKEQRARTSQRNNAKGHSRWRNHIQQVRRKIVDKGEMLKPTVGGDCRKDKWAVKGERLSPSQIMSI